MGKIYRVKNSSFDIEPHEVLLDKMAHYNEEELGLSEKKFEVPLKERIAYVLFGIFFILATILFSRVFYFQFFEGKQLYTQAENNKGSVNLIVPTRGIIYDKNMVKLVLNSPAYDLICDRAHFSLAGQAFSSTEIRKEVSDIASMVDIDFQELSDKIQNTTSSDVIIADNISHEKLLVIESKINNFPSCRISKNTARNYVLGSIFSQVLGYTARINKDEYSNSTGYAINDYYGKSGIERYYETYLRGEAGQFKSDKSILVPPVSGDNLVLNIDANLQKQVYDALEKSIKNVGAEKGAAVAMDPRTGAVLAMISYPSYDNNIFSRGISQADYNQVLNNPNQPFFNRAIAAKYPTGSTIKPFEAAAALQEKIIDPNKQINDLGYILVRSQHDPEVSYRYGGVKPHGWVDMKKALAVSSNIYFYTIGGGYEGQKGLGPANIKKYLSLFGWDERTGVDLPGEFSGFIPDPAWKRATKGQPWWDGDTYNLSIGQSDLQTTPLQVASAYCAIANGGTLYKPQIVSKVVDSGDPSKVLEEFEPQIIRSNFVDLENLEIVREGMKDSIYQPYGSSGYLRDLPVTVAVKTGTAEIGIKDYFNAWSAVFAPYENPEIVLVITVEKVQGFGAVTLPVARDVLSWYFSDKKQNLK